MAAPSSADPNTATEHVEKVPLIEVAFKNGMWWALPLEMSQTLYSKYLANETDIGYTWDWGDSRIGSWKPEDEETTINRTMRVVWVNPSSITARWTGQIPDHPGFAREQS